MLTDELPECPTLNLFTSSWESIYKPTTRSSNGTVGSSEKSREAAERQHLQVHDGIPFSIPLHDGSTQSSTIGESNQLPGCVHLVENGLGQVAWKLELAVQGQYTATSDGHLAAGSPHQAVHHHRELVDLHFTPCRLESPPSFLASEPPAQAGPSSGAVPDPALPDSESNTIITGASSHIPGGKSCRMVMGSETICNTESMAVGVEVGTGKQDDKEEAVKWLRGLRLVRLYVFRRVRTETPSGSSGGVNGERGQLRESLTLLHKSGKLCRYSSNPAMPIRLLFEIPPLRNVLSNAHSIHSASLGCGDVSQTAGRHQVDFFVRVIIESRAGGGGSTTVPGSMRDSPAMSGLPHPHSADSTSSVPSDMGPIVLEHPVQVLAPTWSQVYPFVCTVQAEDHEADPMRMVVTGTEDSPEASLWRQDVLPDHLVTDEDRQRAYRLKGHDVVGDTGTVRVDETTSGNASGSRLAYTTSGKSSPASASAAHIDGGSVRDGQPPPFSECHGGTTAPSTESLPTFDESERIRRGSETRPRMQDQHGGESLGVGSRETADPGLVTEPAPPPAALAGELARWREYDGYETFSAPPPAASASFGTSGSMDPPSAYDAQAQDSGGQTGAFGFGVAEREQLMEHLGLGQGTRVVDTQEDMPPGFDEPSLPALPNAVMPHHSRNVNKHRAMVGRLRAESVTDQDDHDMHEPRPPTSPPPPLLQVNESHCSHSPSDHQPPPPAFSPGSTNMSPSDSPNALQGHSHRRVLPPPSFAASEAAEARGMAATGPEPVMTSNTSGIIMSGTDLQDDGSATERHPYPPEFHQAPATTMTTTTTTSHHLADATHLSDDGRDGVRETTHDQGPAYGEQDGNAAPPGYFQRGPLSQPGEAPPDYS